MLVCSVSRNSNEQPVENESRNGEDDTPPNFQDSNRHLTASSDDATTPVSMLAKGSKDLGGYDPSEKIETSREVNVGDPQIKVKEKERSVTSILKELAAIQQQGPQKYCILGTRHCSYLHQQIIELL